MEPNIILATEHLTKSYVVGETTLTLLQSVNFEIPAQTHVAILGRSGSGKTTFLNMLGGLDAPTEGSVLWDGEPIDVYNPAIDQHRNAFMGVVFQHHHLLSEFTVLENVVFPLLIRGESKAYSIEQATYYLERVGLGGKLSRSPQNLSGGERQRVAIARALVGKPKVVLADEPTGSLDYENAESVYNLMCQLTEEEQVSFVVVTHDPVLAARMPLRYELNHGILTAC